MAKFEVVFDPGIKNPEIVTALTAPTPEETDSTNNINNNKVSQTRVVGILAPLVKVNNITIDVIDIVDFTLKSTGVLPTINITFKDKYGFVSNFDYPKYDNDLYVQILPAFEGKYRKMDLRFYITSVKNNGNFITVSGIYKLKGFTDTNIKSLGQMNTYDLMEYIATETKLGLVSNVTSSDIDKRYIYCDNKSYKELLEREIKFSGSDQIIYDYWVDFWNYLNFGNIKERYETTVPEDDEEMKMWISGQHYDYEIGTEVAPIECPKLLTNHITFQNKENYVKDFKNITRSSRQLQKGVDRIYSIYNDNELTYNDNIIQDGDVQEDIFKKYEYIGENYGDYNYLFMNQCRNAFFQKMNNEVLEVTTSFPIFGICRGQKVLFYWYHRNEGNWDNKKEIMEKEGVLDPNPVTQIPLTKNDPATGTEGGMKTDMYVSGEYLVTKIVIEYHEGRWFNKLTLARPSSEYPKLLIEE